MATLSLQKLEKQTPCNFQLMFRPRNSLVLRTMQYLHESIFNLPFQPTPNTKISDISITTEGIDNLYVGLNPHKLTEPDKSS